ncbi:hypothetical protein CFOL_v3_18313 [Cephalotus follicularis]|uniref:Uncharacterized protein n=1 Tax=Cephalotus follicularis TaxID=3775 RepID=A0A1Q3C431_CEPFO|nr:hypothetical protein CFOL_v3_18313 [Cephalotus follicularis]
MHRTKLVNFIICMELPFSVMDHPMFTYWVTTGVNPLAQMISRRNFVRNCREKFKIEKHKLIESYKDITSFALILVVWTSSIGRAFMCLTTHYIDEN